MDRTMLDDREFVLPVGYRDGEGRLHKTVKLGKMTGDVDEAIADPKIKDNGGKIVTELIHGVAERIGTLTKFNKDIVRNLVTADRDFILVKNCILNIDPIVKFLAKCSECGSTQEVTVDLNTLPVKELDEEAITTVEVILPDGVEYNGQLCKKATVRMANGWAQERVAPFARTNTAVATTNLLHAITQSIEGLPYLDVNTFKHMTKRDRKFLGEQLTNFDAGVTLTITAICSDCGEEFKTTIPFHTLLGE